MNDSLTPLFRDARYTFRFADDRRVDRFHLDGIAEGSPVTVYRLDPASGETRERLATARASAGGWVELGEPLVVRAGEGFVAVPGAGER